MPREVLSKVGTCCGRQPQPGEKVIDVRADKSLSAFCEGHLGRMVPLVRELLDAKDVATTAYYRRAIDQGFSPSQALGRTTDKQQVVRSVRDHGYEQTGYPVFRENFEGRMIFMGGTHRLATQIALDRPALAIVLERK